MTKFLQRAIYAEVGYSHDISHRIFELIAGKVKSRILSSVNSIDGNTGFDLALTVTTGQNISSVEILKKWTSKKYKEVSYLISIPFFEINDKEENVVRYVAYYFKALAILFDTLRIEYGDELYIIEAEVVAEIRDDKSLSVNADDDI